VLNNDTNIVTNDEMRDKFHIIKKHLPIFKTKFDKILEHNQDASIKDLDMLIIDALEEGNLTPSEKRILNGFYESWMATYLMVGSPRKSLEILFNIIGV